MGFPGKTTRISRFGCIRKTHAARAFSLKRGVMPPTGPAFGRPDDKLQRASGTHRGSGSLKALPYHELANTGSSAFADDESRELLRRRRHLRDLAAALERVGDEARGLHLLDERRENFAPAARPFGVPMACRICWNAPLITRISGWSLA